MMSKKRRGKGGKPMQVPQQGNVQGGQPKQRHKIMPWMVKPREVSRQKFLAGIREKYSTLTIPQNMRTALDIYMKSDSATRTVMEDFLRRNAVIVTQVAMDSEHGVKGLNRKGMYDALRDKGRTQALDEDILKALALNTSQKILEDGLKSTPKYIERHFSEYLKARKIPFETKNDKLAFGHALRQIFENDVLKLGKGLNLADFETRYLLARKGYRRIERNAAEAVNNFYRELFGRFKLTPNQEEAAKRWVKTTLEKRADMLRKKALGLKFPEDLDKLPKLVKDIYADLPKMAEDEVLSKFRQGTLVRPAVAKDGSTYKLGTREQRIGGYAGGWRKSQKSDANELMRSKLIARATGTPFDQVDYALGELQKRDLARKTNAAGEFSKLISEGKLKRDVFVKIYTGGPLAQMVFLRAANDPAFIREFGEKSINTLGRGIGNLGGLGRRTEYALRGFQGGRGAEIFDFLFKNGLIEIHRGGKTAGLARGWYLKTEGKDKMH